MLQPAVFSDRSVLHEPYLSDNVLCASSSATSPQQEEEQISVLPCVPKSAFINCWACEHKTLISIPKIYKETTKNCVTNERKQYFFCMFF